MEIKIKLGKYKGLKVKKNKMKVKKEEVNKALIFLQNSRAKIITVNRPAKKGDQTEINFEIHQGGVKIENGASKNHPLILGRGHFLPGFEEKLEGMRSGEEKEFSLKAPSNWLDKRIADKNLDFKVKMNLVQERELPAINDEFARSLGNFKSLDELKKSIKEGLFQEKELKEKERIRTELIEKIIQDSEAEIPENFIKLELERMIKELEISIKNLGFDFGIYLKQVNKTIDELKKEWWGQAEKRVRISLCLTAIAQKENIEVNDEEVVERINQDIKNYSSIEKIKKDIDLNALKEYTKSVLKNEKVFELLEKATIIT